MSIKTHRILEVLRSVYPKTKLISDLAELTADTLLIEPLHFMMQEEKTIHALQEVEAKKILYCSEFAMLRFEPEMRRLIVNNVDIVTANCDFQRNLFNYVDIDVHSLLCDPIPPIFIPSGNFPDNRVVACGNISWAKNTMQIIKIFEKLKGITERVYIGLSSLWHKPSPYQKNLETMLYNVCDTVIECRSNRYFIDGDLMANAETVRRAPNLTIDLGVQRVIDALWL